MTQPLAIVGASTRAAAFSAVRAGFQPIAADLFADADLRQLATATRITPYPEGLVDWLRAIEPPAWIYTGALENHPDLIDQMAWVAPLWGNPGDVLERVRSPWELAAVLGDAGLLFPGTRSAADGLPHDGTWLAKTYRGASGSGVRSLGGEQGAGSEEADELLVPWVFQQRIAGVPCSAAFVAKGEVALLGITRQLVGEEWLGAHRFQYAGSIGPLTIDAAALEVVRRIGNVLAERFELIGLFGVDFVLDGQRIWTLEVNPRYPASIEVLERATGIQAIALHAAACGGLQTERSRTGRSSAPALCDAQVHGKAILFAKRDLAISPAFAAWALEQALARPWPTLADVSPAGTPIDTGRPVLTLFAEGTSPHAVERRLRDRVAEVERKLYAS